MKTNVKFDRRVNIRTRNSDREIFWYAVAVALAAHIAFWMVFNYRRLVRPGGESGSAVTMLSLSDFPAAERQSVRNWMAYNDPRNAVREEYGYESVSRTLQDCRPSNIRTRVDADIPVPGASVRKFRRAPERKLDVPEPLPVPQYADAKVPAAGGVFDGKGRALPLGRVKLPPRTPLTGGRTVLQVFRSEGAPPVLRVAQSCGDPKLDDFAAYKLVFLARGESAPESIAVEWPEADK